jgi:hypothetical protein
MNKQDILHSSYLNEIGGYGNQQEQLKLAQQVEPTITLADVKKWREENLEQKKQLTGHNSYVATRPRQEYQCDLAFFPGSSEYDGVICMIDIFTKYCAAALFKDKTYAGFIGPFKKCINDMKGKPEVLYSDNEGASLSKQFKEYFAAENITHLTTNTHAGVVERLIRTLKDYIYKRAERG